MKKKLIALLLAVMMVVAMLPATVISAMDIASAGETVADNAGTANSESSSSANTVVDDNDDVVYEETREVVTAAPTQNDYFAVVNPNGAVVGYYATLVDADNAVKDGDTIRQLQDYTITATVTLGNGRNKYSSEPKTDATSELPITYTIDGNGYKIIANLPSGSTGMAIQCKENNDGDKLTFKNLFLISSAGGVGLYVGTGKGMHGVFENCKVYAGASYWYVDPTFYKGSAYDTNNDGKPEYGTNKLGQGIGLDNSTVNTYMTIKGKDTVVMTWSWEAVKSAGITDIYDGYFNALDGGQAVWSHIGTAGTSGSSDHKIIIYDGTFVNEKRTCVLASKNAAVYIMGGTFIQTNKDKTTESSCVMSGWDGTHGHVYVAGGTFWLNWLGMSGNPAPIYVQNNTAAATVLGGEFYYTSVDRPVSGVDGASFKLGNYSEIVDQYVNLETLTVKTASGDKLITANYHCYVKPTVTPDMITAAAIAPDKNGNVAEIVIYDKNGNIYVALDADSDTTNGIFSYAVENGGNEYTTYATSTYEWGRSFLFVPEGGTFSLHADITNNGHGGALQGIGQVTFTVQGNGHTVDANYNDYIFYAQGGNVTFYNITLKNSLGRGIQLGNNMRHRHTLTLGEGAKVYAQSGSAAYIGYYGTLIMEDGSELKSDDTGPRNENNALIQMTYSSSFIMNGGKLDHTSKRGNFDEKGFLKDSVGGDFDQIIRVWRCKDNSHGDSKRVWYMMNGITVHLLGGEIMTAHGIAHLLRRQDNETVVDFKVGDVTFSYHEWNPETEQIEKKSFTAKESDSVSLLDENGDLVCLFDSIEETLPYVKNGYTVKLNANVVELHPLRLNLKNVSWTLDFNGYSYYYYAGGQALIYAFGENQDLLMKNGNVYSNNNIMELGSDDGKFQNIVLENMGIFAGGTSHANDVGIGSTNAYFWVRGYNTRVSFIGEDTVVRSSRRSALISEGAQVEIYDGLFTTHSGFETIKATEAGTVDQNSNVRTQGHMTIYGGTFIAGGYTTANTSYDLYSRAVLRATFGATVYLVDGDFIFRTTESNGNDAGTNLLRSSSDSRNGYIYVLGGNYYSAYPGRSVYGAGQSELGFIRFFGGNFYSVGNTTIKSEKFGDKTQGHHTNFNSYYGTFYDEFYTPVNEQGTFVFDENSGVPAEAQGITYNYKATLVRDDAFVTSTWGNAYNEKALRVSYGYTTSEGDVVERTRDLYGYELEAAVWSVGHKGAVSLLKDTKWQNYKHTTSTTFPTTGDVSAYAITLKPQHQSFEWTLNSTAPEGEYYTLEGSTDAKYIFFMYGGTFNIEKMTLQNIKGRVIEQADWYGNRSVINVQNGGEVSGYSECTIYLRSGNVLATLNVRDGGYVNAVKYEEHGDGSGNSIIKLMSNKDYGEVNIYEGGSVGYGRDGSFQAGGIKAGDGKGWMAVRMIDAPSRLNVYGGKLYGNYQAVDDPRYATILTWGNGDGSVINIYGGDIYSNVGHCLYNGRPNTAINIYGGNFKTETPANNEYGLPQAKVLYLNSGAQNYIYGGTFHNVHGGTQCVQVAGAVDGENDFTSYTYVYGGEFIGGNDTFAMGGSAHLTFDSGIHPITGEKTVPTIRDCTSAMIGANANSAGSLIINDINIIGNGKQAIYCGDTPIVINGGNFGSADHRVGVGFNVLHNTSSSDITVNGGTFYTSGHFMDMRGNGVRDIVLNDAHVDSDSCIVHWNPNDTYAGNPSRVVFNGGYYTNATNNSGWGIFNDTSNKSVNTNLTINGGEFYHAGTSRMMKWYGHGTININGGYFWNNSTSDLFQTEPSVSLYITVSGGEFANVNSNNGVFHMEGAGYLIFRNGKDANGNVTTPKLIGSKNGILMYADNMSLLIQDAEIIAKERAIYLDTANPSITHVINGGTFKAEGYALHTYANNTASVVVNGGSFSSVKGTSGPDTCVSIESGKCTINAGTFEGNGMCVVRVLGGKTGNEFDMNGTVQTVSKAVIEINGGVFHLLESDRNSDYDAVVRAGGGSTYGWIYINGGTFISDSKGGEAVINKNNVHGNLYVDGGIFMTSGNQENYFRTSGNAGGSAYPYDGPVAVNKDKDMQMTYGGKSYYTLMFRLADEDAPVTQSGAQIRLIGDNMGIRFVSRIDAETVAKYAAMEGVTVTYGTLIAPLDYIMEAGGKFTKADLEKAGLCALDIEATEQGTIVNADGSLTIRAAMTNIKSQNRDRVFAAIAYVSVVDAEGNETRVYGAFNTGDNARSLAEIAEKSLNDVQELKGVYGTTRYIYESLVHEGMFSRYTADQQRAMMACIPAYDAK